VAGSTALTDFLVQRCRSYIYSTAIAPPVVAATRAAIGLMPALSVERERLRALGQHVRSTLQDRGWQVPDGRTPIIPVIVGTAERALELSDQLAAEGCYVPAIRPPTVPPGSARLRLSLSAAHTDEQIQQLLAAFCSCPV
jgi:8-amino-7-oxononanoate synthase